MKFRVWEFERYFSIYTLVKWTVFLIFLLNQYGLIGLEALNRIRLNCFHGFFLSDHVWPQNTSYKLATSITNKASYQILTRRYGILQSTPFKEPDNLVGTTEQPMRPALKPNVTTQPNLPDIVRFGPYRPHEFVIGDHVWPQNASNKLATNTTNKASYWIFTHRCGILHFILIYTAGLSLVHEVDRQLLSWDELLW